ncbi:hypothetical protein [Allomesorhizobium alhagi]|uniref:Uncharacterized protein n=1 Tax=Mesorhizobium alhagi CCNWXJ12-2 TaxID=1107882 RepID=H0HM92_9HYPH|nr:hypothetical protein [Mesorhizobium alhagi]EHK58152.1 hypothetical protein MAXJ12_06280 [Mesorhizobium alhagi CCNWXJ12-2]
MATIPNYSPVPFGPATTRGIFDPLGASPHQQQRQRRRAPATASDAARLDAYRRAAMQMAPSRPSSGVPFSQRLIAQGRPSENVQIKPRTAKFDPASLVMAGADLLLNMVLRAPMGPKPPVSLAMERAAARDRDRLRLERQRSNIGP